MPTALLEKPSLMDLSLSELISQAIALGGEKVHDMAKAIGHVRHKKTWAAVIESIETEPTPAPIPEEIPFDGEADEADEADEIELIYSVIPGDRTITFKELWEKTNLPSGELAGKLLELELAERVIQEPYNNYRRLAVDCPPPPPPAPIIRTCPVPERQDIPGIEIAKEEKCGDVGSDRRECTNYKNPCLTCDQTGLLDKNLTCVNCNGKGWRSRPEQLTMNIRIICRTFISDIHDTCWGWQALPVGKYQEVMNEISTVRWGSFIGKDIWQLARRIRELYQYCDERKPNWGPLYPTVSAPLDRIDENHWLLLLIFPPDKKFTEEDHPYFASDMGLIEYYCPPKIYDKWGNLGNTHMFILPNELQEKNILSAIDAEYLVLRGENENQTH